MSTMKRICDLTIQNSSQRSRTSTANDWKLSIKLELETKHQIRKKEQELGSKVPRRALENHDSCSYSTSARDKSLLTKTRGKDIGPVKMEKFKQQYEHNLVFQ